jgi:hypothetical protein
MTNNIYNLLKTVLKIVLIATFSAIVLYILFYFAAGGAGIIK